MADIGAWMSEGGVVVVTVVAVLMSNWWTARRVSARHAEALASLYAEVRALHAAIRILAASQRVSLPPGPDEPDEGGGRFEHWENFLAMPTPPDVSEVAPEGER